MSANTNSDSNVTTCLQILQHQIDLTAVRAPASAENVTRLERALSHIAAQTAAGADPVFLPRDESSARAWLPLGIRDRFDAAAASTAHLDGDLHVAFGDVVKGIAGFRLTHQQALAAQAVALAGGSPPPVVTYGEVAPVAMMLGSEELLRPPRRRTGPTGKPLARLVGAQIAGRRRRRDPARTLTRRRGPFRVSGEDHD